jgi:hypothetical protein
MQENSTGVLKIYSARKYRRFKYSERASFYEWPEILHRFKTARFSSD